MYPFPYRKNESAKLRALRAHVPTGLACLRVHVPKCHLCLRAHLSTYLVCLRANVPCVFTCPSGNLSCVLTCSGVNVSCLHKCSRANMPCLLKCSRDISSNNKNKFFGDMFYLDFWYYFLPLSWEIKRYMKSIYDKQKFIWKICFEDSVMH